MCDGIVTMMNKRIFALLLIAVGVTATAADGYMSLDSCRWMTNTRFVHEGKAPLTQAYAGLMEILGLAEALPSTTAETENMYYDLLGRPVGFKPSTPGVYVTKGKKIRVLN